MTTQANDQRALLFYDGHCGLCHRSVLFTLKRDPEGRHFRFAPLQGPTFETKVDAVTRATLPDSVVVLTPDGRLRTRSDAALFIATTLGGIWRPLGHLGRLVPRPLRDLVYDGIARIRHRLFAQPNDACPLMPPELRDRFDP